MKEQLQTKLDELKDEANPINLNYILERKENNNVQSPGKRTDGYHSLPTIQLRRQTMKPQERLQISNALNTKESPQKEDPVLTGTVSKDVISRQSFSFRNLLDFKK